MIDDLFYELWAYISTNTSLGWGGGLVIGSSLLYNYHLYDRLKEREKNEEKLIDLLEKLEPLLSKIIDSGQKIFKESEIEDAKTVREFIKFRLNKK
ncbi:MAG: hypothetical protein ACOCRX_08495 [Candidatus Woesearchaeota archaeon]